MIQKIKDWELATIRILNLDGWELEPSKEFDCYDAIGKTPKGVNCVIEMKFRNDYYETKMLEVDKYNRLMAIPDCVKIYFVNDAKGNYMFWLDSLEMPEPSWIKAPKTTMWNNKNISKNVYMLHENKATIINRY